MLTPSEKRTKASAQRAGRRAKASAQKAAVRAGLLAECLPRILSPEFEARSRLAALENEACRLRDLALDYPGSVVDGQLAVIEDELARCRDLALAIQQTHAKQRPHIACTPQEQIT